MIFPALQVLDRSQKGALPNECHSEHRQGSYSAPYRGFWKEAASKADLFQPRDIHSQLNLVVKPEWAERDARSEALTLWSPHPQFLDGMDLAVTASNLLWGCPRGNQGSAPVSRGKNEYWAAEGRGWCWDEGSALLNNGLKACSHSSRTLKSNRKPMW